MNSTIEEKLNHVSPSFCLAKWLQVTLLLQNGLGHSCHHPAPEKIPLDTLLNDPQSLHNHEKKLKVRQQMLQGEFPSECTYCWNIEKSGGRSDRLFKSEEFWAEPHLQQVLEKGGTQPINPKYMEVSFSHNCNFKCAYCGPQSSSRWVEEIEQFGAYPTSQNYGDLEWFKRQGHLPIANEDNNPYIDAFWSWWPQLKKELQVFRITGGEPLMSRSTWKILDDLSTEPQPQLHFAINSNLGVSESKIDRLIEYINNLEHKIEKFTLFTSIDSGIPAQAEYIRYGLDFQLFQNNVEKILKKVRWRIRLTAICTINALSIPGLLELMKWNMQLRQKYPKQSIGLDTPYLRFPNFLALPVLPFEQIHRINESLAFMRANTHPDQASTGFSTREHKRLTRVENWAIRDRARLEENPEQLRERTQDLTAFLREYDLRRKIDFHETFPNFPIA